MTTGQWFLCFLLLQAIHFASTWKFYKAAGRKFWEAAVPVYSTLVLMDLIKRPRWWVALLFIPIINLLMIPVVWVETARSFGYNTNRDTLLCLFTLGFYLTYINYTTEPKHLPERSLKPENFWDDLISSLVFAVVAATLVHTYIMQPFAIPTGSLERTLRIGDFLFVSKYHYGARVPTTALALPIMHDTIPVVKTRSYLKKPQLPYMRLPGFQDVQKNHLVVFNWPADTVRQFFVKETGVVKPMDKKSNYVKRCVGTPGDTLEIRDGDVFINGEKLILSDRAKPMHNYKVYGDKPFSSRILLEAGATDFLRSFNVQSITEAQFRLIQKYVFDVDQNQDGSVRLLTQGEGIPNDLVKKARLRLTESREQVRLVNLTEEMAEELRRSTSIDSVVKDIRPKGEYDPNVFPHKPEFPWNNDQFGPIYIPRKGDKISLSSENLPLYKKMIASYENRWGNEVAVKDGTVHINGEPVGEYTFRQDYYWMMGDNRDYSEDSRVWGYVPGTHIMGKPVFIWMSYGDFNSGVFSWNPRWDRWFTTVGGKGEPVSYLPHFLICMALIFGYREGRRRWGWKLPRLPLPKIFKK